GGECLGTRSAGSGLLDAEALVDRWIAGKSTCPVSRPSSGWSLSDSSLSIAVGEDAAPRVVRWRGIVDHLGIELRGSRGFPGAHPRARRPPFLPQRPRQSELVEGAGVGKPGDRGYPVAVEREDEQSARPRDVGIGDGEVAAEGGLAVRTRWHQALRGAM